MEQLITTITPKIDPEKEKKRREKRLVKTVAFSVGLAFSLMLILPSIAVALLTDLAEITKTTNLLATLYKDQVFLNVFNIVLSVIAFVLPCAFVPRSCDTNLSAVLPFKKPEKGTFWPTVFMGLGFCAFGNLATSSISEIFSGFGIEFTTWESPIPSGVFQIGLAVLASAVTPALIEEFAMRGVVGGVLKPFGEGFAIMVSSVIFALMHCNFVQIPFAFIVGLALGFALIKTKSLWAPILIHFLNNAISVVLEALLAGNEFVTLKTVVFTLYFAVCFGLFFIGLFLASKKEDFFKLSGGNLSLTAGEKALAFFFSPTVILAILLVIYESSATVTLTFI